MCAFLCHAYLGTILIFTCGICFVYEYTYVRAPLEASHFKASPADTRNACVRVRVHSERPKSTVLIFQTTPDQHPQTPPPCRLPTLITIPTLATVQLDRRRVGDVVLLPSCLVKHRLIDAPLLIIYFEVSFSSHSSFTLYSCASFEWPTLSSVLRPASLPPSFPSSFVLSALLPLSLPASLPPPWLASSLRSFLPPVHPPTPLRPSGSGGVAKLAAGVSFSFY